MEEEIQKYLYNPTVGKLVTFIIGVAIIWILIKLIQKNLFSKIKDNDNRYKATKISSFIGYVATVIFLTVILAKN
jgi:uncharacterized membrane protein YidH (DUF202 family)